MKPIAAFTLAIALLFAGAPAFAASSDVQPRRAPATATVPHARVPARTRASHGDVQRYRALQQQSPRAAAFRGGAVVVIGASALAIVLAVILVIVLI